VLPNSESGSAGPSAPIGHTSTVVPPLLDDSSAVADDDDSDDDEPVSVLAVSLLLESGSLVSDPLVSTDAFVGSELDESGSVALSPSPSLPLSDAPELELSSPSALVESPPHPNGTANRPRAAIPRSRCTPRRTREAMLMRGG